MRIPRYLTALAWLGLATSPLLAQSDDLARVRAEFGEVFTARISAAIESGVQDGLPRSLLLEKAVEGAAKHMEPEVVLAAVRTLADELRGARGVVGPDADAETLSKTADALRHGVDREVLIALHAEDPDGYPVLVVAIEDLLHAGVTLDVAQSMILDAASRGLQGDELLVLPATVRRLVREGSTPRQAASSVLTGLRTRGPPIPPPLSNARVPSSTGAARTGPPFPPF